MSSEGAEATEFAALCGLVLDPWQAYALECLLQKNADGSWVTKDGLIIVPRQNGKGAIDEAWALSRVFLRGVKGVLHTAHEATTAFDAFKKMRERIEASEWLFSQLRPDRSNGIRVANGEWGFTFKNGAQINYRTRTGNAGRGLTVDDLILDEIQHINDGQLDALTSVILTKPYGQTVMTGSAPIPGKSEVLSRLVAMGRSGNPGLAYLEWSCDETLPYDLDACSFWAQANPGYGIRLFDQAFLSDRVKLSEDGFAREHLGIVQVAGGVFPLGAWEACEDPASDRTGDPVFGVAVSEERHWASIGAAAPGGVGTHVDSGDYKPGTAWVVPRCVELAAKWPSARFMLRPGAGAGALLADFEKAGLRVVKCSTQDYAQACGALYDAVAGGSVRHRGQPELEIAVTGTVKKVSGDGFCWDQRRSSLDISPLEAVTLAFWGHLQGPGPSVYEERGVIFL